MKGCTLTNCCITNLFNVSAGEPLVHLFFFFLQSFLLILDIQTLITTINTENERRMAAENGRLVATQFGTPTHNLLLTPSSSQSNSPRVSSKNMVIVLQFPSPIIMSEDYLLNLFVLKLSTD